MVSVLLGALVGLIVIGAFILGTVYGKGITIHHKTEYENTGFITQPQIEDEEIRAYMEENKGLLKF